MKKTVSLFLVFIAAVVSVFVVQFLITKLWGFAGVSWGPGNLPVTPAQKIAMLSTTFLAGLLAPIVAIAICRKIPWGIICAICVFGMGIDIFAALAPLASLPTWFKVAFVVSVPLQVIAGTMIGSGFLLENKAEAELT
ncbi:hypothetical protein [Microbulbifer mangrovi]|uniref:hypothetical protein n=1 Tax=Microbulbifer mangrovi TaxID=927787 RepID=UPI000990792C|nr:hypothetical protein [Microbulbifer mangrovi]